MALPALALAREYLARAMIEAVPARWIFHPVTNEANAPHLRLGEFAVVDTGDRAPISGDLFLIQ